MDISVLKNNNGEEFVKFTGFPEESPDKKSVRQYGIVDFGSDTAKFHIDAAYLDKTVPLRSADEPDWEKDAVAGQLTVSHPSASNPNHQDYGCRFMAVSLKKFVTEIDRIYDLIPDRQTIREFWLCSHEMFQDESENPGLSMTVFRLAELIGIDFPPVLLVYDTSGIKSENYLHDILRILQAWIDEPLAPFAISLECLDYSSHSSSDKKRKQFRNLMKAVRGMGFTPFHAALDDGTTHKCVMASMPISYYIDCWEIKQWLPAVKQTTAGHEKKACDRDA